MLLQRKNGYMRNEFKDNIKECNIKNDRGMMFELLQSLTPVAR